MRSTFTLSLLVSVALGGSIARGTPDPERRRIEASAPAAGFSRRYVADTVPATLPRARTTTTIFATVKVSAEVGEDE